MKNSDLEDVKRSRDLQELRTMILGLDPDELNKLHNLIQDPDAFSEEIRLLLPRSIKKMFDSGDVTVEDLLPIIEVVLKESIQRNPTSLANILFPIMIPAVRKAVSEDIKRMLDSLNSTLEKGFSPKRIGWRIKAMISNKSYTEIILSHAYIFQVKQVFLIHRETGLLLSQVADESYDNASNADMVSSMLTAIKDFVKDSFNVGDDQELDTINVGDLTIWIEQGPYTIIAAIVEGNAPKEFRVTLKEAVETIHYNLFNELEKFEGDTSIFESNSKYLLPCLQKQEKEQKKKKPVIIIALLVILLGFIGYWSYTSIERKSRFNNYIDKIKYLPGLNIFDYGRTDGSFFVKGMKDPLATDPSNYLDEFGFDTTTLKLNLTPFISLDTSIVLKRINQILIPPETISLRFYNGILYASGEADKKWIEWAKEKISYFPIVKHFDISGVKLSGNTEELSKNLQGIKEYYFKFGYNKMQFDSIQRIRFMEFVKNVNFVIDFTADSDSVPLILVTSHTSYSGNPEANKRVAIKRSNKFIEFMTNAGIPANLINSNVNFIEDNDEGFPIRSVSFKVEYNKK